MSTSPTFTVSLEKQQLKRTQPDVLKTQLLYIAERGVAGNRKAWEFSDAVKCYESKLEEGILLYTVALLFRRNKNTNSQMLDVEMKRIVDIMQKAGNTTKWFVTETKPSWSRETNGEADGDDFVDFDRALSFDEIAIPDVLISGSDREIENHPAFKGIYGRAPHVRVMASSMKTMLETKGNRRNHLALYGLPGCGKSSVFHCWQQHPTKNPIGILPHGSYIRINANSATKAGIERLFLERLRITGIPPFIFVEEMEKTLETILTVWLSILDERAEVRKITHRSAGHSEVRSLVFGTVNDKVLFDRLMGGRPNYPGALSSRMTGIYVPRPDEKTMSRILRRDIGLYYPEAGKDADKWVKACVELAAEVKTNDPRKVVTFLDGRSRLLNGDYQKDIIDLYEREAEERHNQFVEDDFEPEAEWMKPSLSTKKRF